ncbi:hypothetical protein LARI1_G004560 [Lachnellula arida]|uniref:C2H2-type domain-containing protein n=1 Tax=Lachnellula arida TaxID=1316785 RepID=A0A8T9BQP1_9HELO|nr:hypothetical protein LARI1_G004560 [Lachnellula arida]
MQAQRPDEYLANQMDTQSHFSQPAYPDMGLGGLAEGGSHIAPNSINNPISSLKNNSTCPLNNTSTNNFTYPLSNNFLSCFFDPASGNLASDSTLNYDNTFTQGILGGAVPALPATCNISHAFPHPSVLPLPSGALLHAPTPDPIYNGYVTQDNGFMNAGDSSYGSITPQYPLFAGGHNVPMLDFPFATNLPSTAGFQAGFFLDQSTPLNQNDPQPSQYCPLPWNAMPGTTPDAFSITDTQAAATNPTQWDAMDFSDNMLAGFPIVTGSASGNDNSPPPFTLPAAPPAVSPASIAPQRIPCTFCPHTFARASDRTRHENSKHLTIPGTHLCPVPGCVMSRGNGFSRADKVTEHLWRKHGGLGFVKRV